MIRAVIFDLYGVLGLNGWQAFKKRHFSDRPEEWERLRSLGQSVDAHRALYDELIREIALSTNVEEAEVRHSLEATQPNTELLDYIQNDLSAYKIGVLSNANQDVMSGIFSPEQLELFDATILSYHVGLTKPDGTMFELMSEKLDVPADQCIFVDDKAENIVASEIMGMTGVLYQDATQCIDDISGVLTQ